MMNQTVESVTASLFREYLYRNNYRSTLEALDKEVPRTNCSITNRLELAKVLHILKLIKANKHREKPYPSMAEMIVADLIAKASVRNPEICIEERQHSAEMNSDGLVIKGTFSLTKSDPHNDKKKPTDARAMHQQCMKDQSLNDRPMSNSFSKARMMRNSHLKNIGKSNSTPLKEAGPLQVVGNSQKSREIPVATRPPSRQKNSYTEFESLQERSEAVVPKMPEPTFNMENNNTKMSKTNESLEFIDIEEDIDDELQKLDLTSLRSRVKQPAKATAKLEDLTVTDAIKLREIVFGNATSVSFNPEWEQQSFTFNDKFELEFGLVQHKGGPCGILAAVQALVIKHLMAHYYGNLSPSNAERQQVLTKVLASILWQAANYDGGMKYAYVCYDSGRSKFQSSILYRKDGITEKLQFSRCSTLTATENCVQEFLPQFQSPMGKGCILFLYSLILSRGVDAIKADLDEPGVALMANHGYCSQELVNLCMMGYSAQNVFNDVIDLDGKILKGIREPRDIGLLTLYEYYKVFEVGSYLKRPSSGIWVICSESHYSVLFSKRSGCSPHQITDLYYYDSLGNQESLYKLTVYPDSGVLSSDEDPPLELCIRTLWNSARVDWNGSEPLL
ncbi:probable ubiquitin carboxyl-terminal hydrolase MINDY-4 isoform X2 [Bolinopsis microptera]